MFSSEHIEGHIATAAHFDIYTSKNLEKSRKINPSAISGYKEIIAPAQQIRGIFTEIYCFSTEMIDFDQSLDL